MEELNYRYMYIELFDKLAFSQYNNNFTRHCENVTYLHMILFVQLLLLILESVSLIQAYVFFILTKRNKRHY